MLPESAPVRIARPQPAPPPPRSGFPLIATLAPVGASVAIWAATGSLFSLLFAGLGPVVALGGLLDGRRQRRRDGRRDRLRIAEEEAAIRERIAQLNARERVRRAGETAPLTPDAIGPWAVERWSRETGNHQTATAAGRTADGPVPVRLGTADVGGVVELTGDAAAETARLPAAPLLADARDGIGLIGPEAACRAVARSLLLQLAATRSPAVARVVAPAAELAQWAGSLPHATAEGPDGTARIEADDEPGLRIGWGTPLPPGCGIVVRIAGPEGAAVERMPGDGIADGFRPAAISAVTARELAARLAGAAAEHGIRPARNSPPARLDRADLPPVAAGHGLAAAIGHDGAAPVVIDLVADGPHALIGGTTGSGKSELLVSWVLGMAAARSPEELTFLLIDFKGGAAFAPLSGLPHVVGILSDLDASRTRRAIDSLRAEVLRRERILAERGARSIDELEPGRLARLVVVVDEFAAVVSDRPELHEVFADLAARGRSLGLHLVLCTQRPSGVVRDAVLANVTLRIGLRMTDRADSIALLGGDIAARLPADPRGRAVLAGQDGPREFQVAIAAPDDVARLRRSVPPGMVRLWREPLPAVIELETLHDPGGTPSDPAAGIVFGRLDLPDQQSQPVARYHPDDHGHLLALGAAGSGKSMLLRVLGSAADAGLVPADPADAWSTVVAALRAEPVPALLLLDDLDLLLARFDADARPEFAELLARLLRERTAGVTVAATAQRLGGSLHDLSGLFGSRLLLRQATREEHVLAGGHGPAFDAELRPGAGQWRGATVQVAVTERRPRTFEPATDVVPVGPGGIVAAVTGRPRELGQRLRSAGIRVLDVADPGIGPERAATVVLGDPDAWQAEWAVLTRARREWPIVVERCSAAELRAVTRIREVPPPLRPGECWLVEDGGVRRARWAA